MAKLLINFLIKFNVFYQKKFIYFLYLLSKNDFFSVWHSKMWIFMEFCVSFCSVRFKWVKSGVVNLFGWMSMGESLYLSQTSNCGRLPQKA